jgi:TolB protein
MNLNMKSLFSFTTALLLGVMSAAQGQDIPIPIIKEVGSAIPIALVGFTGEVQAVLSFDLAIHGFTNVPPAAAAFILTGNNTANSVQAQLTRGSYTKTANGSTVRTIGSNPVLFSKGYTGNSLRPQAHKLNDDVVKEITGVPGIAEVNGQVSRIAFKVENGATSEIYVSDFDGHNALPATQDNSLVAAPCWVPGRFALYYTSYKQGNSQIFYQDLGTGSRQNFAHFPGMNSSAAVSPDGNKVAMILSKSGSPDLWVSDANGSNLKQLTFTPEDESSPCWSPDGKWICFATKINERRSLYKVSVNGGAPVRIRTDGANSPSEPDWSPDGKWIIFTAQWRDFELCVVPAEGGEIKQLVPGEDACWAPNSRTVVFVRRNANGSRSLSLLDVPTKQVKDVSRVAGSNASNSQPTWAK